jgi:hypothetical protein
MTANQAVQAMKKAGATPEICKRLPRIALEEAIKAVMSGQNIQGVVDSLKEIK